jgi:hypothetical protein
MSSILVHTHDLSMPMSCLCAGLHLMLWCLSLMLWSLSQVLWLCATPALLLCGLVVVCVLFVVVCGLSLRAGQGVIPRLNVSNVGSSHCGRDAKRSSTPRF